jgi:hypothetical protein
MIVVDISHFDADEDQYRFAWCNEQWGPDKSVWIWEYSIMRGVNQYVFDTADKADAFRKQWEPK